MDILQILELVNTPDVIQGIAERMAEAVPVNDLLARGSNPFIPDQPSCDLPLIKLLL